MSEKTEEQAAQVLGVPDQRYNNRGWKRKEERAHWTRLVAVAAVVFVFETAGADIESDHQN